METLFLIINISHIVQGHPWQTAHFELDNCQYGVIHILRGQFWEILSPSLHPYWPFVQPPSRNHVVNRFHDFFALKLEILH